MSYNHKLVSAVQDSEIDIDLNQADWPLFPGIATFAREVKRALRMGDLRVASPPGVGSYCYIYRPQDKYIMGRLEYDGEKYSVYSRTIENKRYSSYNSDHYTKSSKDMKKAVKHALAYLRPYKPMETAQRHGSWLWEFVKRQTGKLEIKRNQLVREVIGSLGCALGSDKFEAEMRHLVQSGHNFLNPEIGENLAKYFEVKRACEQAGNKKHDMVYLRVYVHNEQQLADIATIPHKLAETLQYKYSSAQYMSTSEQAEGVPIEQLSDNLIGRVSVLSMLQVEQGEPGVGFKASDSEFFIYPESEVADA